ncbi:MAG TPA: cation diffusion facilitator family transporter, partial [Thermoanaerobaculia bacterium]|nr:cation diffusion facilitator family transporter [Thermoanaerobaculia bacterium]
MDDPRKTPLVAVGAAAFLVVLKAAAASVTGSLALGSAALDSLVDLFVSGANYLVLRRAAAPPDADHAYGHGKFENLAALFQGVFLLVAGGGLVWAGVNRLIDRT